MDGKKKSIEQLAREFETKWNAVGLPDMVIEDLLDLMDYYARMGMEFEAELCRRIAERKDSQHPEVVLTRAHWYADDGDWANAEQTRQSVVESSNYENLLFTLEHQLRSVAIRPAFHTVDEALPAVLELPEYDFLFDCAGLFRDYGYVLEACHCLDRIPSNYIDFRQVEELRAECEALLCDYVSAKTVLNRLLDESPFDQNLWAQLATCCFRQGESAEAADACEYSLAIGPDVEAERIKELVMAKEQGAEILANAVERQDYIACLECADIAYSRKDYVKANLYYSHAGLYCPRGHRDREKIVFRVACCLIHAGYEAEAYRHLLSLYALGGEHWGYYYECAQLFFEKGEVKYGVLVLMFTVCNGEMTVGRYDLVAAMLAHYDCYEPARGIWQIIKDNEHVLAASYVPYVEEAARRLQL